jgi:hypothetical protein
VLEDGGWGQGRAGELTGVGEEDLAGAGNLRRRRLYKEAAVGTADEVAGAGGP